MRKAKYQRIKCFQCHCTYSASALVLQKIYSPLFRTSTVSNQWKIGFKWYLGHLFVCKTTEFPLKITIHSQLQAVKRFFWQIAKTLYNQSMYDFIKIVFHFCNGTNVTVKWVGHICGMKWGRVDYGNWTKNWEMKIRFVHYAADFKSFKRYK